ncbi:hypothetical protein [Roseofilum capinflatum]|uniref:Uncharacterized protein n=1 Tax=Roseofilum capinflatum BLCC-M114 TaxID=3022440 RepID=A0ABT7BCA5_9CYAN|nr:hypothetical protein [Roseofilum capinflatum]MDJ1176792.1 hypothetical protein [Roseofilum capinflatum BLCC-M114]
MLLSIPEVTAPSSNVYGVKNSQNSQKTSLKAVWVKEDGHLVQHWIKA